MDKYVLPALPAAAIAMVKACCAVFLAVGVILGSSIAEFPTLSMLEVLLGITGFAVLLAGFVWHKLFAL